MIKLSAVKSERERQIPCITYMWNLKHDKIEPLNEIGPLTKNLNETGPLTENIGYVSNILWQTVMKKNVKKNVYVHIEPFAVQQ